MIFSAVRRLRNWKMYYFSVIILDSPFFTLCFLDCRASGLFLCILFDRVISGDEWSPDDILRAWHTCSSFNSFFPRSFLFRCLIPLCDKKSGWDRLISTFSIKREIWLRNHKVKKFINQGSIEVVEIVKGKHHTDDKPFKPTETVHIYYVLKTSKNCITWTGKATRINWHKYHTPEDNITSF